MHFDRDRFYLSSYYTLQQMAKEKTFNKMKNPTFILKTVKSTIHATNDCASSEDFNSS